MNHNLRIRLAGQLDTDGIVRCRTVPLRERLLRLLLGEQRKLTIPIVIPPANALKEFSAIVAPIAKEKLAKSEESAHLSQIRDTLLPRLMSGELSVADIAAK